MPKDRTRRRRRTKAEWFEILRRFESSGLGPRAFCRREGLASSSFQRWRAELAEPSPEPGFVELTPSSTPAPVAGGWTVELSLPNGVQLRLRG